MAGFHLAGGSVDTGAFFLFLDNLGVFQIFVHGGGDFQAQVIVDVHSIHLDKNRDVIGHAHHFTLVHADAVDQGFQIFFLLSIGAELRENVSHVLFEDCDVIHDVGRETAIRVYHCDDAVISNVTFQNIRVEEARRLISCWIGKTRWTKTQQRGHIRNVVFRDITAVSAPIDPTLTGFQDGPDWKPYVIKDHASMELVGFDEDHIVDSVLFDNVVLDGKKVTAEKVTRNEFVKDVRFE